MEDLVVNLDLFVILKNSDKMNDSDKLFDAVVSRLDHSLSDEDSLTLKIFCQRFTRAAVMRWKKSQRNFPYFKNHYGAWLEANIDWPSCIQPTVESSETSCPEPEPSTSTSSTSSIGTMTKRKSSPRKPFEELSTQQKKRRTVARKGINIGSTELAYSAVVQLREEGQGSIATVIEYMLKNPEEAHKFMGIIRKPSKPVFSPEKALGLFLSLKLTKWQYVTLRETAMREGAKDIYPSYYKVQKSKLLCYPPEATITVTDNSAKITLQGLLDKTAQRILESLPEVTNEKCLTMICKWGFDGASNQSRYKQSMSGDQDDSSVFMTTLVPLKITREDDPIWINPRPCSSSYCRPVQFIFTKESKFVVTEHQKQMEDEINALRPVDCGTNVVNHKLMMTMIDGKICTYLSDAKSSSSCYLCLAKPSNMNDLDSVKKRPVSVDLYKFGLSTLHARINTMECLLHIAYRLDLKKWAVRGDNDKAVFQARKKVIQDRCKAELNLLIDIVKQGSGTTNDGNTARRFFEFPEKTAAITGLDEQLIRRLAVILQAVTSGQDIDTVKFKTYAFQTAARYVELYNWYYMPATVHKLLIHGADIIASNAIIPIGGLSEEASESRNKDFRRFREHNSRKKSRISSNRDILNMLLLSSDPVISATRPKMNSKIKKEFFSETLDLLKLQETDFEFLDVSNLDSDSESDSDLESDNDFEN